MPDTAQYISDLNATLPTQEDGIRDGDNEIRTIKTALLNSFAGDPDGVYNSDDPDVFDSAGVLAVGPRYLNQLPTNFADIINDILLLQASIPTEYKVTAVGTVNGDGTVGAGSLGFTSTKIGTGHYRITLETPLSLETKISHHYAPLPSPPSALTAMYHCYPDVTDTDTIDVYTYLSNTSSIAAVDLRFSVHIVALA